MKKKNLKTILETKGEISVMVDSGWLDLWSIRNDNPLDDAETLKYGKNGNIIEIGKKPKSLKEIEGQYTGLIKISNNKINEFISFYEQLDKTILYDNRPFKQMFMTTFLQLLIDAGWVVMPAIVKHGWLEIDTTNDLLLYEKLSEERKLNILWNKMNNFFKEILAIKNVISFNFLNKRKRQITFYSEGKIIGHTLKVY